MVLMILIGQLDILRAKRPRHNSPTFPADTEFDAWRSRFGEPECPWSKVWDMVNLCYYQRYKHHLPRRPIPMALRAMERHTRLVGCRAASAQIVAEERAARLEARASAALEEANRLKEQALAARTEAMAAAGIHNPSVEEVDTEDESDEGKKVVETHLVPYSYFNVENVRDVPVVCKFCLEPYTILFDRINRQRKCNRCGGHLLVCEGDSHREVANCLLQISLTTLHFIE